MPGVNVTIPASTLWVILRKLNFLHGSHSSVLTSHLIVLVQHLFLYLIWTVRVPDHAPA